MELGELRPILTALILPPASPLLLAAGGMVLAHWRRRTGTVVAAFGLLLLWLLSCAAVSDWLAERLLQQYPVVAPQELRARGVQAIVIVGGGIIPEAPEYGEPQLNNFTTVRARYGAWLARQTGLPLAYAGGVGWAAVGTGVPPEGVVARRIVQQDYGITLRWVDEQSRDTMENGRLLGALLKKDGIRHVAVVTQAYHMPRSVYAFEAAGLQVTPAPTRVPGPVLRPLLDAMPSAPGLDGSRLVLHEWLGLQVARLSRR